MSIHENKHLSNDSSTSIVLASASKDYVDTVDTKTYHIEIRGIGGDHIATTIDSEMAFRYKELDDRSLYSMIRYNPYSEFQYGIAFDLPAGVNLDNVDILRAIDLDQNYVLQVRGSAEQKEVFTMLKGDRDEAYYILPPENLNDLHACDRVDDEPVFKAWCNDRIGMSFILKIQDKFDRKKLKLHTFWFEGRLLADDVSYDGKFLNQSLLYQRYDEGRRAKIIWH